ncbi:MAG: transcriptional repressor NrdR [Gammaproteobacteria bacterium]|nr:transcriptional repressor NrdR [Gammaproteobacteria bacterium]
MHCPYCGAPDTRVVDSRLASEGSQVRRRRECAHCGARFTTFETVELDMPQVVKSDGGRQAFDADKLRAGIERSVQKRPVSADDVAAAIDRIKRRLVAAGEREISSRTIGEWVMDELKRLDQVAFVRFASVYRRFEDVNAFREEIEKLESQPNPDMQKRQIPLLGEDS